MTDYPQAGQIELFKGRKITNIYIGIVQFDMVLLSECISSLSCLFSDMAVYLKIRFLYALQIDITVHGDYSE